MAVYRVFIASSSDVPEERQAAREVIHRVSVRRRDAGVALTPVGWEETRAGLGRPQELINPEVRQADLLIGVMWKRFGTPTGVADSGTEEEFGIILERYRDDEDVDAMLYFREPPSVMLEDPGPQLQKLLDFRTRVERLGLHREYRNIEEFRTQLEGDLERWLDERLKEPPAAHRAARPASRPVEPARDEALTRYLEAMIARNRYVPIAGFETRVRVEIGLEDVVVPVRVRLSNVDRAGVGARAVPIDQDVDPGVVSFDSVWERLASGQQRTLVILGAPGAGKTTMLKGLLLSAAQRMLAKLRGEADGDDAIPLLLPLRQVDPAEDLDAAIARILETEVFRMPADFFDAALRGKNGRAILLLDGLDEVSTRQERAAVARWIERQRDRYPNIPIVVTARFAGYVADARLDVPHLEVQLQPFGPEEVRGFLKRWFVAVETNLRGDTEFYREEGVKTARELFDCIQEVEAIRALARNPLLLQIIALVHRDRGTLPDRRVELYDECVNVLLEHWDRVKGAMHVPLKAREARRILQPLAYWMHQEADRRFARREEIEPIIERGLREFPERNLTAAEFLSTIRDRSGLFVGFGTDEFGFQHLTFQEYLAARNIRERGNYDVLVDHYGDAWWREVTRLLVGLDDPPPFEPFMRALIPSPRFLEHSDLTLQCIVDAFAATPRPLFDALQASLEADAHEPEDILRQYQLMLVLRTMAPEQLMADIEVLEVASRRAVTPEARDLARTTLVRLGIEVAPTTESSTAQINKKDGTELLLVPAGPFVAGDKSLDDNPSREEEIGAFLIARYPVTNAQYRRFLEAAPGYRSPMHWDDEQYNQPEQPVVGVSWHDAEAYCRWAGLRLPTEWEWEKAARGTDGRPFPWGNPKPDDTRANFNDAVGKPTPVGSYAAGPSPCGAMDMAGNVWEWTASTYGETSPDKRWRELVRDHEEVRAAKTLRGGAFGNGAGDLRCAVRGYSRPDGRGSGVGFRCAQDPVTP